MSREYSKNDSQESDVQEVESQSGVMMLEKAGVSDPECDNINGHTFMAAALKNLFSEKSTLPERGAGAMYASEQTLLIFLYIGVTY